jgi:hypothetical protein
VLVMVMRCYLVVAVLVILLAGGLGRVAGAVLDEGAVYVHEGDLVVAGNETLTFENCTLIQNGNIFVRENGTLILKNCELVLNQSGLYQYRLEVRDGGRLLAVGVNLSSEYGFDQSYGDDSVVNFTDSAWERSTWTYASGGSLYMQNVSELGHFMVSTDAVFDDCTGYGFLMTMENADVEVYGSYIGIAYVRARDSAVNVTGLHGGVVEYFNTFNNLTVSGGTVANLTILDSDVRFGFEPYDSSLAVSDCDLDGLEMYGNSSVSVVDSTMISVHVADGVNLSLYNASVQSYIVAYANSRTVADRSYVYRVEASDEAYCSFNGSSVSWIEAYESSVVRVADSELLRLSASQESAVSLVNCCCIPVLSAYDQAEVLVSWYLDVHVVDSTGQNVSSANVTAFLDAALVESELTGADGLARLVLLGKTINATGEFPVAEYSVNATYLGFLSTTTADMTGNGQITLTLEGLIIPELQTYLMLPLLILSSLLAFATRKKKLQSAC